MKRSTAVVLGVTFVAICTGSAAWVLDDGYERVCVEDSTDIRVEEEAGCDPQRSGYHYVYMPNGTYVAPHGQKVTGGTTVKPVRGGFGSRFTGGGGS